MKSKIDNDEGNIGIITEEREQENEKRRMNRVVDQLEQRIFKLEKVLQSHAKCIGELRGNEWNFAKVQSAINIKLKTG